MRFEHLVEINDPGNPTLEPLTAEQLWQGLVLRAESPELFVLGLERAEVLARGDGWLDRVLHFGQATIQDRVVFEPRRAVRYETAATARACWRHAVDEHRDPCAGRAAGAFHL